jgi:hypothetical protein
MKSALYEVLLSIQRKTFAPSASYYSHDLVEETIKGDISPTEQDGGTIPVCDFGWPVLLKRC